MPTRRTATATCRNDSMTLRSNDDGSLRRTGVATAGIPEVSMVIFLGLAAMGLALPALPARIHGTLGFDLTTAGWAMGVQSAATLVSRPWAGRLTDRRGGRRVVMAGLAAMAGAGLVYALSALPALDRHAALGALVAGRLLTGLGVGLIVTGGGAWVVGLAGMDRAGRAMSWIGLAMFGGLAAGAAAGAALPFGAVTALAVCAALAGIAAAARIRPVRIEAKGRPLSLRAVTGCIWRPGTALALSAAGFAAVSSFVVLAFEAKGWPGGGNAIAAFGIGHVGARLLFAGLADKAKGPAPAAAMLVLESLGLGLIWLAPTPAVALAGAALGGFGFSMVYPLMALPALRRVPEASRGLAIGLYDAFFDVAMGVSTAACGLIAGAAGLPAIFLFAGCASLAAIIAVLAAYRGAPPPLRSSAS